MPPDILEDLNPKQREAVETIDGPILIIAGPGSGKTRVITHRIAYLVRTCGVTPYRVAAVTFTNRAAREMRLRLHQLLGPSADELTAGTFHSFCAMLLRREGHNIGLDRNFVIYDDADQGALIKRSMGEVNVDPKQTSVRAVQSAISSAKSQLLSVEGFGLASENYFDELAHRVYERYEELLSQSSAVDFDDLLLKTHFLLDQFDDVAARYQNRYVHFMIDEFQDTNVAQYAIAKQLSAKYRNLCVVGDPDQSIYTWRNADIRNILSFQTDFPEAKVIALEESYRCTQTILDAAHRLIASNEQRVEKNLWTRNGRGVPIVVGEGYNEQEEAQFVLKEMDRLVRRDGYKRSEIAVMYRVNAQSRAFEEACLRYGVPYVLVGSLRFYHRQEIKDLTAFLRLVANSNDDVSFARAANVPPRGIGRRTLDEVTRIARDFGVSMLAAVQYISESNDQVPAALPTRSTRALENFRQLIDGLASDSESMDLIELIDLVLERTGYKRYVQEETERGEERLENIQEFRNTARDFLHLEGRDALTAFLESVSLVSDTDNLDEKADAVTLITLHQAKGLEFHVVFIVGLEEGLLPHIRSMDDPAQMEEERRLCYVGITRAKERLYLHRAFRRGFRGGSEPTMPSRFLADLPQELIVAPRSTAPVARRPGIVPEQPARTAQPKPSAATLAASKKRPEESVGPVAAPKPALATGDKVRHAMFGDGIVTSSKPSGDDFEVTVAFKEGRGIKRLLLGRAPLEKVE
jgi:DNA helicase-2/ATP-dependent DNA helicase PcrA